MTTLEVFDPPMCCGTGACGPEPDARLTRFATDLNWLKHQGVAVRRYNLAQEPAAFTANPQIKRILDATGSDDLPVILLDGRVVSQREYPSRQQLLDLAGVKGQADTESGQPAVALEHPPIFNEQIAELVALGAAMAGNCEPCFEYHHRKAVELGISPEDMIQAVNVALQVKDQPAQAMVRVARKHLVPEAAQAGDCCGNNSDDGSCC
jgi:AhpD family alkylhydroperoxidase